MVPILEVPSVRRQAMPISVETYHALGLQGMVEERTELLRGVIVEKIGKSPLHEYIASALFQMLLSKAGDDWVVRKEAPLTFVDSEPEPDIAVVAGSPAQFRLEHPRNAQLVIEVAVSSAEIDREKASIYAEAGVPEFWLVLPAAKAVEVWSSPARGTYTERRELGPLDVLTCGALPGLKIDLNSLFSE